MFSGSGHRERCKTLRPVVSSILWYAFLSYKSPPLLFRRPSSPYIELGRGSHKGSMSLTDGRDAPRPMLTCGA